jgi:hypothetical protein
VKKSMRVLMPCLMASPRRTLGRVDSQHRNAGGDVVPEQVAVVARQFEHQAVRTEPAATEDFLHVAAKVRHQRRRNGRVVGIVAAEKHRRLDGLQNLHQAAVRRRKRTGQRALGLRLVQHVLRQQSIRQRRDAKVQYGLQFPEPQERHALMAV